MVLTRNPTQEVPVEIWRSPFDPVPWLGRAARWRWSAVWWCVRRPIRHWERRLGLAVRLWGCRSLAEMIQLLTRQQVVRSQGALPVLLALLKRPEVRAIINRHCPTRSPVTLVLVLNRLMAPRPLYKVVDWLATTLIAEQLGFAKDKLNDDRLGRTLDILAEHLPAIWSEIQQQVLLRYRIDLPVLFHDLTAWIMTGQYEKSELVDYGFAHNSPLDDPKIKLGLVASRDGGLPLLFQPWSGRTADKATVQTNMAHLRTFLQHGWSASQVLLVGDCANLSSALAFADQDANLRYLAGLAKLEKAHRELLLAPEDRQFEQLPLAEGYWGVPCDVVFAHQDRTATQRGLVVRSDPLRQALRQERREQIRQLLLALHQIQGKIGQKRYRTETEIAQRIATQLKRSAVGKLVGTQVTTLADGKISLAYPQRLARYRQKDTLEKRFEVSKQDLKMRPLPVHSDERIQAMLLLHLIALLAYSLLERQAEQAGLCLTARRIIARLAPLQVQVLEAWDGSQA